MLTNTAIKAMKPKDKPYKRSDSGGLYLYVTPSGSKLWRLAYRWSGKQKTLAIGTYPEVTLEGAREARMQARRLLIQGIDPSAAKQAAKREYEAQTKNTFGAIADEWLAMQRREGKAEATLRKIEWLVGLAKNGLAEKPIAAIQPAEVLAVLRRVEAQGNLESARRLRGTMGRVFRYAIATARAENDPTYALKGALTAPTVTHRAAITDKVQLGHLLRDIDAYSGNFGTRAALQLLPILFVRPGELQAMAWEEIDFDNRLWTIPAERTKMRRDHLVPLPRQAVEILETHRPITRGHGYIFRSNRTARKPISNNTLNAALRRMGYEKDQVTAHGFRATASSLLNESGLWSPDAIERQLAHVEVNEVRRAYARSAYWDERVRMMQWWADFLDEAKQVGQVAEFPQGNAPKKTVMENSRN